MTIRVNTGGKSTLNSDLDPGRYPRLNPGALSLAAALVLSLCLVCAAPGHAEGNTPVFVLHSYSQEYPWTKRQHEGFLRALGGAVPGTIAASVEYLDTKRVPYSAAYADLIAGHLARKYAGFEPKLIYVTDDNALLFALAHLTRIFPGAPVFFSGVNDYDMKQRIDPRRVTGVFENKEIAPNLELMRHLAPGVRDILVVGDESETYQAIRREIVAELANQPDIRAQFLSAGRIERLVASLQGRTEQFVFLTTLGAMTNAAGSALTLPETIAAIVRAGQFIVISMEDAYLYPGVLGGYVTSGNKQGAAAAALSARHLAGEAVAAIPPIETSPNEYIVDGAELEKLGLTLPAGVAGRTTILNPLPTFYERHLTLIVRSFYAFVLLFVASLVASIFMLMRKNRQIARTSKDLAAQGELMSEVQERLVQAQRIAGIGSWEWTPASDAITWSEGLNVILARDIALPAPTIGTFRQFYAPESRERLGAALARTRETGAPFELELEMLRDTGAAFWTTTRGEAVRAADGAVVKLRGTVHDIDGRKRAEEVHARLAAIVETSNDAVVSRSLERKVLSWNSAAERLFGYSAAEAIGQNISALIIPPEREAEAAHNRAQLAHGRAVIALETVRRTKDGRLIDVSLSQSPINDEHGAMVGVSLIFHDITGRKQAEVLRASLEAQLRESQKMEALGTLAGGVAHDFNNALAAIMGNVELARQDVGPGHAALESLAEIGKAGRRAKDLVQQILAFGRRQNFERKATSLALVVVETARLLRATLPAAVSLSVDCKGDTPAVLADATQVKQILLNLCGNALQAVQDQGRPGVIEIRLDACDRAQGEAHGALRPGRYARLTVRDNGLGMDEATRSRIFEPFFTTKPRGKGTGLGLSVVHGIVQAHEAGMEVASTPGAGSEFRIYFPAVEAPVAGVLTPAPETAPVRGSGQHVLYVDDEEAIIFLMKRLLERQGYRVSGYTDPREALAAARANPDQFDLAVTDYNMPGMSGLEVASALRAMRPDLPIAIASGYITDELRQMAPAAGVSELIYKPNTVEDLCEAVARLAQTAAEALNSS